MDLATAEQEDGEGRFPTLNKGFIPVCFPTGVEKDSLRMRAAGVHQYGWK